SRPGRSPLQRYRTWTRTDVSVSFTPSPEFRRLCRTANYNERRSTRRTCHGAQRSGHILAAISSASACHAGVQARVTGYCHMPAEYHRSIPGAGRGRGSLSSCIAGGARGTGGAIAFVGVPFAGTVFGTLHVTRRDVTLATLARCS